MMISKIESGNGDGDGNSNSGQLLHDIEAISKALYLHNAPQKSLISPSKARSRSVERPSKSSLNPKALDGSVWLKDKKGSLWNWKKPLKALAHFGQHKFNVCFFLHVHSIEGLPPSFNDMSLSVRWKRKDEVLQTHPSRVLKGTAEFGETLAHRCSVYGSRSGTLHSAKYEPKIFLIYASVVGAPGVHMGKQWVDLTRLLPLTLEELEGEKGTGRWTTSFKLTGKAKGATLNFSLGFSVIRDNWVESGSDMRVSELLNLAYNGSCMVEPRAALGWRESKGILQRSGSIPGNLNGGPASSFQSVEVGVCDEVSPRLGLELAKSMNFLYQKLNLNAPKEHRIDVQPITSDHDQEFESGKDINGNEYDNAAVFMTEQGIEISEKEQLELEVDDVEVYDDSAIEIINVHEIFKDDDEHLNASANFPSKDNIFDDSMDEILIDGSKHEEDKAPNKGSSMEDLESMFLGLFITESGKLESPLCDDELQKQENYIQSKLAYKAGKAVTKSLSLDEVTESVANEFLNMLRIQHSPGLSSTGDPESPRERLLREFEEETLVSGSFFADYCAVGEHEQSGTSEFQLGDATEDFDFSLSIQIPEEQKRTSQLLTRRRRATLVEDLETEALMREWGLSENTFQSSPRLCSDGFGSPIELLPEEPVALPPLGEGFGPFIWTKDGGCLRSMNPSIFRSLKCVGSLIMQASRLVVLPSEMGSDVIDILRHLASGGIEKLTLLANELLPLEDVTGKTLQQMVMDDTTGAATSHGQATFHYSPLFEDGVSSERKENGGVCSDLTSNKIKCSLVGEEVGLDFVTLEDLSPLIMDKIADLSIEGLRIQSGMSEEAAPSTIGPQPIINMLALVGKGANLGGFLNLERAAELRLSSTEDSGSDFDELFGLSTTLEEWSRLDAGIIGKNYKFSEHLMKILAAHHAKCVDFANGSLTRDLNWDEDNGRKQGLFGNRLTVAVKVLLRDPLRNYEPVGASMLALTQLERSFFRPRPEAYSMSESNTGKVGDDLWIQKEERGPTVKEEKEVWSPCFRITEVHLSGLSTKPDKINPWGSRTQQRSGTRWLLASGMSTSCKQPLSKSKAIVVSYPRLAMKMQNSDSLWSISSQTNDMEPGWNNSPDFVSHIRNPNITFLK